MMNIKLIFLFSCAACLLVGFSLFPFVFGKKLSAEYEEIVIYNKIGVLDNVIVEIYGADSGFAPELMVDAICTQLNLVYEEAKSLDSTNVALLDSLDYGKQVEKRLNQLAIEHESEACALN